MATNYPGSLDNFTNPTSASPINSPSHADQHSNANDAIEAIEGELGANPKGAKATVKARLDDVDTAIALKAPIASPTFTGTVTIPSGSAITGVPYLATANTFTASQMIQPTSTSAINFVLRAVAGQTSHFMQLQNQSGAVISYIDTNAIFNFTNNGTGANSYSSIIIGDRWIRNEARSGLSRFGVSTGEWHMATNPDNSAIAITDSQVGVFATSTTLPLFTVKGMASQTANLQEWQNSAGTVLARVNQFGDFYITGGRIFRGNQDLGANLNILNESDLKGIVVKAVSGQTKNLTELQSSTGAVLSGINPIGQLFIRSTTPITAAAGSQAITSVSFTSTTATYTFSATEQTISIGEYVTVFGITPSGYNGTYQVTSVATVSAGSSYSFTVANTTNNTVTVGTGYFFPSASVSISTQNKAHTGLIIKAVSGQTSSVMEIQNSLGQPATWWDSAGGMTASMAVVSTLYSGGFMNTGTLGYFNATTFSAAVSPIVVRGAVSQSANLTEWQNSAGTVLSKIDATGNAQFAGFNVQNSATINGTIYTQAIGSTSDYAGNAISINSGKAVVMTPAAASVGLVIKGAASQSASLQEWQNSSGTMLASIIDTGFSTAILKIPYIYTYVIQGWNGVGGSIEFANATPITIKPQSASVVNLAIKGAVSQTADLQQWQDSAGTALAGIGPNGRIYAQGKTGNTDDLLYLRRADNNIFMYVDKDATLRGNFAIRINQEPAIDTQAFMWSGTGSRSALGVSGTGSTNPTFYAKATASQTSNLTEWQDSSGTALSYIKSDGSLNFIANSNAVLISGTSTSGFNRIISNGNDLSFSPYFDGLFAPANSSGRWRPVNDATSDLGSSGQRWKDLYATSGILTNNSISKVGLIVKAITSQTANLQEWQNSIGTVLAKVDKDGNITAADLTLSGNLTVNGTTTNLNSTNLVIEDKNIIIADVATPTDTTADGAGITIKGATDKTFNWVQSTGRFTSSEPIQSSAFVSTYVYASQVGSTVIGSATLNTNSDTGGLLINTAGAANKGLTIRGAASQTASLQEWQNSDAVSVAQISATGTISTKPVGFSGNLNTSIISVTDRGSNWTPGNFAFRSDSNGTPRFSFTAPNAPSEALTINGNYVGVQTPSPTSVFQVTSNGAGNTVSIIKGAVSQTANLQEWQNSAGYAGTAIDSYGSFYAPGIYSSYTMQATAGGAAVVPLTVKGASSQTAKLQEWKNSTNTVVASVGVDGFINTNGSIRIAGDNLSVYRFQGVFDGNYTMNFPGSGNIQLFSAVDDLGGGSRVLGIKNATTVPTSNPTTGGILYVNSGALNYMGTSNVPQQIIGADGSVKFTSPVASITPLIIQHTASPTSSYFEIRNSTGNPVWGVNSAGEALTRTTTKYGANIQNDSNNASTALTVAADASGAGYPLLVAGYGPATSTTGLTYWKSGAYPGAIVSKINYDGSLNTPYIQGNISSTISANTATTVDTVALSSFTTIEYTISIKQGSKVRSSKVLVHTDGTSIDSTEYGIMEMGGGITGILVTASVSSTNSILQVTITDASTTNATVKIIKTML